MPTAFWITPFTPEAAGGEAAETFAAVQAAIRQGATDVVELVRADDIFQAGVIIEQIRGAIERADVVIAVCTGRNANVFYELGLAEIAGHKPILVAASPADLPFDVAHWRAQMYGGDQLATLADRLRRAIEQTLEARASDPGLVLPSSAPPEAVTSTTYPGGLQPSRVALPIESPQLQVLRDDDFIAFNEHIKAIVGRLAQLHIDTATANEGVQPTEAVLIDMRADRFALVGEFLRWIAPAVEYQPSWAMRATHHTIPWFNRRATKSDSGFTFWIGLHKSWVVLTLRASLALAASRSSWSTVEGLLAVRGVQGQRESGPLLVDTAFIWPDGYGGNASVAFNDHVAFEEWSDEKTGLIGIDGTSRACGADLILGLRRCVLEQEGAGRPPGVDPHVFAGFASHSCERIRWLAQQLDRDGAATATLGMPDPARFREMASACWDSLTRRSTQGLRNTCWTWDEAIGRG